ncbi:MAG: hypothetical protein WCW53_11005 [Syntrophales bacterium]|jgi:hypothetical protein
MSRPLKSVYVTEVKVTDPDSGTIVTVGIYKDPDSNGLFGVEKLFLEQMGRKVPSPYNECTILICDETLRR